jgi:hypothetical protein
MNEVESNEEAAKGARKLGKAAVRLSGAGAADRVDSPRAPEPTSGSCPGRRTKGLARANGCAEHAGHEGWRDAEARADAGARLRSRFVHRPRDPGPRAGAVAAAAAAAAAVTAAAAAPRGGEAGERESYERTRRHPTPLRFKRRASVPTADLLLLTPLSKSIPRH